MFEFLRDTIVRWVFGGGIGGSIALRGVDWLVDESRQAVAKRPVELSRANLQPGDSFTVIARPPDSKAERKLAKRSAELARTEQRLSATTARRRKAARKLRKAQKRLDRRRPGTRRHANALVAERAAAKRFDKVMSPSRKLAALRTEKERVDAELAARREVSFRKAAGSSRPRVTVYDGTEAD